MLNTTLRRLEVVQLNMRLVPHDSLSETDMNILVEVDESCEQSIVVAPQQYGSEIEIQSITEQARYTECASVYLMLEGMDIGGAAEKTDALEIEDEDDALLVSLQIVLISLEYNLLACSFLQFCAIYPLPGKLPGKLGFAPI
jgi:nucleosome binding factor SPN SPT16 subunit